jgi:multiple sugar transport system substrate-binding protein
MNDFKRRDFLKTIGTIAAGSALGDTLFSRTASAAPAKMFPVEPGAKLRVLRWKPYVQADEDAWLANTKEFTRQTGVEVQIESDSWDKVRPLVTLAATQGSGHDIIFGWYDDPQQIPDKLVDLTDLAQYLGPKYGGWYEVCQKYGTLDGGRWIGLPIGTAGSAIVYRDSHVRAAGFSQIPRDMEGFLALCRALKAKGTPAGFALGRAIGDAPTWCYWLLWSHGARVVDEKNRVVLNSAETIKALLYGAQLYPTFVPGTLDWTDASNNKAFLSGEISLTSNAISVYYAAKNSKDPKVNALTDDIQHAHMPIGPVGRPTELNLLIQGMVFKYTKYPNAAKEYLRFMLEKEQYEPWQRAMSGYITQSLKAYESNPVWQSDPKITPFRDSTSLTTYHGYAGSLGAASASTIADFIVVNMVADVVSGKRSPSSAAFFAQKRTERYYNKKA